MADKQQNLVKYGEIISKCWEDDAYKKRFIEDPESVLAEAGFAVEEGVTYKVIEQPKMVRYVVIPYEGAQDAVQTFTKYLLNAAEKKDVIIPEGAHHPEHRGCALHDSPGVAEIPVEGRACHGRGRRRRGGQCGNGSRQRHFRHRHADDYRYAYGCRHAHDVRRSRIGQRSGSDLKFSFIIFPVRFG